MKKLLCLVIAVVMLAAVFAACAAPEAEQSAEDPAPAAAEEPAASEPAAESSGDVLTEEEGAELRDAGTLEADPLTGFDYVDETGWWSYSNYPNYKDFAEDGKFKIAVICKTSGAWFENKHQGMQDTCDKYGYEFYSFDAQFDEQAWMDALDNVINQDYDLVIMTPVNTTLLPEAVSKLQAAGIAYVTADDPSADANGFYPPHCGLYDWYLANETAKVMCEEMIEQGFMDNVADDYSNFLLVLLDGPQAEAIHNRNVGTYDAVMEYFPDLPEDRVVWVDCGDCLADDYLEKMGSTLQAYKDSVDYWVVSSGGVVGTIPTMTLFQEAGIDIPNQVRMIECFATNEGVELMLSDPDMAHANYGYGLVPYPVGVQMIEDARALFEDGTPIPTFRGYDLLIVKEDTVQEYYDTYCK